MTKVNNRPIDENSPNLIALAEINVQVLKCGFFGCSVEKGIFSLFRKKSS
jgi:hypothetical protein